MAYRSDRDLDLEDTDKYRTPTWFLDIVRSFRPIGLDPFGHRESLVNARRQYLLENYENAYIKKWHLDLNISEEIVYANPPYSKPNLDKCLTKFIEEARLGVEIVGLYPSDTSTGWFRRLVATADAIAFPGRIQFVGGKHGSPPFPSCVPYYGSHLGQFINAFKDTGPIWQLV